MTSLAACWDATDADEEFRRRGQRAGHGRFLAQPHFLDSGVPFGVIALHQMVTTHSSDLSESQESVDLVLVGSSLTGHLRTSTLRILRAVGYQSIETAAAIAQVQIVRACGEQFAVLVRIPVSLVLSSVSSCPRQQSRSHASMC